MVPRWSQASPVGFFAAADLRRGGCTPHSFSSWRKRMRRARWKKKPLGPNLPVRASLGMRTVVSHDRIKPARSHPSALKHSYQITLMPQVVTLPQIPGCLSKRLTSGPAAAPWGWIPKEGAAAPSFWSFRKGVQGETQPKGFPPGLSLGATRFSRREKWVAYAQVR